MTFADFYYYGNEWHWPILGGYGESGFWTPAALVRLSTTP